MSSNTGKMQALLLERPLPSEPPTLHLTSVSRPALTPGHVLVRVRASAIHPSDVMNARGLFPYTTYPRIPGRDWAGVVEEGAPEYIGRRVFGTSGDTHAFTADGFQAEYALVREDALARMPEGLSFAQAAAVGVPYTTAGLELEKAGVREGDTVLVIGATGAVGSAAVQLARNMGARVLEASRRGDADVNTATDPELSALDELTGGKGVDVVVDTVGSPALVGSAMAKLALHGRFVFISAPKSGATEVSIDLRSFYRRDLSLHGVNSLNISVSGMAARLDRMRAFFGSEGFAAQANWTTVPLSEAAKVYEGLLSNSDHGKYVVVMD